MFVAELLLGIACVLLLSGSARRGDGVDRAKAAHDHTPRPTTRDLRTFERCDCIHFATTRCALCARAVVASPALCQTSLAGCMQKYWDLNIRVASANMHFSCVR